jgi:hypothetical protein
VFCSWLSPSICCRVVGMPIMYVTPSYINCIRFKISLSMLLRFNGYSQNGTNKFSK